jgi:REP element-mobilizing transposase RayT
MKEPWLGRRRKSEMTLGGIYFWTSTINNWEKLLWPERFKIIIINSLTWLSEAALIDVFGFVIMPTHVHFIWRLNDFNGRETAQASFLKYTAHEFRKLLLSEDPRKLKPYKVDSGKKQYEFWQRDPLAIRLYSWPVAFQKLNYIHKNPLANHWQLVKHPCDYKYSSARFYDMDDRYFNFLRDLRGEF